MGGLPCCGSVRCDVTVETPRRNGGYFFLGGDDGRDGQAPQPSCGERDGRWGTGGCVFVFFYYGLNIV